MVNIFLKNLDTFIEAIPDLAFFKNTKGEYVYCNELFLNVFNKCRDDVIGKTDFDLFPEENARQFRTDEKKMLKDNTGQSFEEVIRIKDGENLYFHTTKEIICDDRKTPLGMFCIARDITKEKQYEIIYNDSQVILEYELRHAERYDTIFGVMMIDIDFFKEVNDKYGHQAGDQILCEFASILKKSSRDTDIIERWGGEEFLIIKKTSPMKIL